jgi:hypothetical protein
MIRPGFAPIGRDNETNMVIARELVAMGDMTAGA